MPCSCSFQYSTKNIIAPAATNAPKCDINDKSVIVLRWRFFFCIAFRHKAKRAAADGVANSSLTCLEFPSCTDVEPLPIPVPPAATGWPLSFMPCSHENPILSFSLFQMSVVQEFTATNGKTEHSFRLQKSAHHLLITRTGTVALIMAGLMAGLPEKVTAEVTHPVRKRVQPLDRVPLAHVAAWAQFGRSPIQEFAQAAGLANPNFGKGSNSLEADQQITVTTTYYINDQGPLELLADDQFNITISGLVPGASYRISAPEMPILPAYAQQYYAYEQSLILEGDRDKTIYTKGVAGLIFPNNPAAISRVTINWSVDGTTSKEEEYTLEELMNAQQDGNPVFNCITYSAPVAKDIDADSASALKADFLVLDTVLINSVTIYTVLGQRVEYTTITLEDRNLV